MESYLSSLSGLELTDYVTYTAGEEDLSTWGLDDPELTVTVTGPDQDGESQTVKLSISRDPAEAGQGGGGDGRGSRRRGGDHRLCPGGRVPDRLPHLL